MSGIFSWTPLKEVSKRFFSIIVYKAICYVAHSEHLKEFNESIEILFNALQYSYYKWKICGDLKIISILMGTQEDLPNTAAFSVYEIIMLLQCTMSKDIGHKNPGFVNIQSIPLVNPKDVFIPPLCIKLELIKNFVKALGKSNSNGFAFFCNRFSRINKAKMKEGIFVGPKPWKVLKDPNFEKELTAVKWHAWKAFQWPCKNFLGNTMSPLPQELKTYLKLTTNELLHVPKVHFYTHI